MQVKQITYIKYTHCVQDNSDAGNYQVSQQFFAFFPGFLFWGLTIFFFQTFAYQGNLFETHNNNENLKEIKDLNVGRKTEMIISAPSPSHLPSQMVELGFGGRGHEGVGHCCHCAIVPLLNFVPLMLLQFHLPRPHFFHLGRYQWQTAGVRS